MLFQQHFAGMHRLEVFLGHDSSPKRQYKPRRAARQTKTSENHATLQGLIRYCLRCYGFVGGPGLLIIFALMFPI